MQFENVSVDKASYHVTFTSWHVFQLLIILFAKTALTLVFPNT